MMRLPRIAAISACLALPGCVVGPDYATPRLDLPVVFANAPSARPSRPPALARWWQRLGDPLLSALIEEAVHGNLDVATARARIREARASRRESAAQLFPSVTGNASANNNRTSASTVGGDGSNLSYNQFQAGFDASFELDLFGARAREVEAADRALEAAESDLSATLLTLVGDVAAAYSEARGYQARVALARRSAATQRQIEALTRRRFQAGTASAADVARAAALAASTEAAVPTYEASYAQSVHRLGVLTGRPPSALIGRMQRGGPIPSPRLPLPAAIPADVIAHRPDVRRAERQLAQYTARIGQAEAALYPSVSLTGSLSTSAIRLGDLARTSSVGWTFGPSVSVPLFNAGRLRAAVDVAEAQRDQYLIAWRAQVLTALQDVENALVALSRERQRLGRLGESAQRYREAARLSRSQYETGTASFLDVLDIERSLYTAEDAFIESRIAVATDYIALAKALGGGWSGAVDSTRPEVVDQETGPHARRASASPM